MTSPRGDKYNHIIMKILFLLPAGDENCQTCDTNISLLIKKIEYLSLTRHVYVSYCKALLDSGRNSAL